MNNHTGDAHGHVCARTHHLHAHSTQHMYSTYIWSTHRRGNRNHALTSLQPCTSATSLMVMTGRDGMRSSTQQRTEQRWESLPFPGPCATPESTPCCSWIIVLSSAPLGWCAQHTFSKSSWFLLMKSCLSSTQCESCLTKNIAQSAFQSATKESVCSNQPARAVFFPPSLPAQSNWFWQMMPTLAGYVFKNSGARIAGTI